MKSEFASVPIEGKYAQKSQIGEAHSKITIYKTGQYILELQSFDGTERTDAFQMILVMSLQHLPFSSLGRYGIGLTLQ